MTKRVFWEFGKYHGLSSLYRNNMSIVFIYKTHINSSLTLSSLILSSLNFVSQTYVIIILLDYYP